MHKFFTEEMDEQTAYVRGDDHKHLFKVLRLKVGDKVVVNDLKGQDYAGEIQEMDKQWTKISIREKILDTNESPLRVTLFQGLPKAGKMDLIVQKCTELGVMKIVPVDTARVVVKSAQEYKKMDRLKRIALEAAKQSKRSTLPEIVEPISFEDGIKMMADYDVVVVPYENQEDFGFTALKEAVPTAGTMAIFVGPEGGFTEEEIHVLRAAHANIVTLGKRILRTETAGFTAVAMAQLLYGDMGGKI